MKATNIYNHSSEKHTTQSIEECLFSVLEIMRDFSWPSTISTGIFELEPINGALTLITHNNLPKSILRSLNTVDFSRCLYGCLTESEDFLLINCYEQIHHALHEVLNIEVGCYILPLKDNSKLIGVLVVYLESEQPFNEKQSLLLNKFSETISHLLLTKRVSHEKRLSDLIITHSKHAVMLTDNFLKIQWVNKAFEDITGYLCEEVVGKKPSILSSGEHGKQFYKKMWDDIKRNGYWEGEIWNQKKTGEIYPELLNIVSLKNEHGIIINYAGMFVDMTSLTKAKDKIKKLAYFDELTGLANRSYFLQYLDESIKNAKRRKEQLTLLFLDLDGFKFINDTFGHNVGDQLLSKIGIRLKGIVRETDFIARLGGDEFCILINNNCNESKAANIAENCLEQINKNINIESHNIQMMASIGIASFPNDSSSSDDLMKAADTAMYESKLVGENKYTFYDRNMTLQIEKRIKFEKELLKALSNNEFELYYQPKIQIKTGKMCGVEALIRWNHPIKGIIAPDSFIPILEQLGVIDEVGLWVVRTACQQLKQWHAKGCGALDMAVNISSSHFEQNEFSKSIQKIILETGIEASKLEIEITESIVHNIDTLIETCNKLKKIGVRIAIDDFGTGYSSLSMLNKLQIHTLKIDKFFIDDLFNDTKSALMLGGINSLARGLGCDTVVEGVETRKQLEILSGLGFNLAQGYYFSKPVIASRIPNLATKNFYD